MKKLLFIVLTLVSVQAAWASFEADSPRPHPSPRPSPSPTPTGTVCPEGTEYNCIETDEYSCTKYECITVPN